MELRMPFSYKLFFLIISVILITGCSNHQQNRADYCGEFPLVKPEDKVWAHRVDQLDEIGIRLSEFSGIEIDIFYDEDVDAFEVKHDKEDRGIDLEFFLDSVSKIKSLMFWFDYKNLDENTGKGVEKLLSILNERGLNEKAFVESYHASCLQQFKGRLTTSFWVSSSEIPPSKEEQDELYESKYKQIREFDVCLLSASYEMFEFLTTYFPEYKLNFWIIGPKSDDRNEMLKRMVQAENVNIILIDGNHNPLRQIP